MKARTPSTIKTWLCTAFAALVACAFTANAGASVVRIHFSGAPGSGYADLTLGAPHAGDEVNPDHSPMAITGASGMFNGVAITGVRGLDPTTAAGEVLPYSYSLFPIPGYGDHDGVSYDNLFYPTGSPLICYVNGDLVWPFSGGFLDLMGVMFALDNGDFVDLWSFGVVDPAAEELPPFVSGLTYGLKVIQPNGAGGYEVLGAPPFATASIPEPDFFWLFGAGVLGLFAWRRSVEKKRARIAG
ncbi:MAG: PEP-CTERM sorting domain-containing protein [Rhodanobacteraceae bacterium]|nr:MAG: PEP-CTERM sorting domain-containing protein [Rhodanobacteraceae bacterium]